MALSNAELEAKADELQVALDAEQEQIAAVIEAQKAVIAEQEVLIADGGTVEDRQRVFDKMNGVLTDLQATIPDEGGGEGEVTEPE